MTKNVFKIVKYKAALRQNFKTEYKPQTLDNFLFIKLKNERIKM